MLTIKQLQEIVSSKNYQKICLDIEELGFRFVDVGKIPRFEYYMLRDHSSMERCIAYEDAERRLKYEVTAYQGANKCEGMTNVRFALYRYNEEAKMYFPWKMRVFTDAPFNEEYEMKRGDLHSCICCLFEYAKTELIEMFGKYICPKCLAQKINEEFSKK